MVLPDAIDAAAAPIDDAVRVAERVCPNRCFLYRVSRHRASKPIGRVASRTRSRLVARRSGAWESRDWMRISSRILAIKSLIGEVREIYGSILHGEGAAAVFVRASANVEGVGVIGRNELSLPALIGTVDEASSLLLRLRLGPVDRIGIQCDLVEPDRSGHNEIGRDRGGPGTIRADNHWLRPVLDFWR